MNKCILCGNLGKTPELSFTQTGVAVCKFSIAVNERWKDSNGEKKEKTEWFNIVVWRGLAETCAKFLEKGRKVLIEGKLQTRTWDDDSGKKCYMTEVVAKDVEFLGGGEGAGSGSGGNYSGQGSPRGGNQRGSQGGQDGGGQSGRGNDGKTGQGGGGTGQRGNGSPSQNTGGNWDGDDSDIPF